MLKYICTIELCSVAPLLYIYNLLSFWMLTHNIYIAIATSYSAKFDGVKFLMNKDYTIIMTYKTLMK